MNRIERLAALCAGSQTVCDVGCDHAYVLIQAIKKYGVQHGIACDIAEGPLAMAKKSILASGLSSQIDLCLSDGFSRVKEEFDTAVLAGMGGSLISDIILRDLDKIKGKRLIIQANNDRYKVRRTLWEHGFWITGEFALYEQDKYYEIFTAEEGFASYDELDLIYGPILRREKNEAYRRHCQRQLRQLAAILSKIQREEEHRAKQREYDTILSILGDEIMEQQYILNTKNYYTSYFIDDEPRPTVVISPGGGYAYTSARESAPVARVFNGYGYHAVVVNYRETPEDTYPLPAKYLAEAILQLRRNPRVSEIIGLGFSAGGHNLLEVSLHTEDYGIQAKPDLLMLGYPVITADERYWHQGSFKNLLGDKFEDSSLRRHLSLETQVTATAPDLFLWGTFTDESVSVMNSLLLVEAYKKVNLSVEYHLFPMGGHGLSVANAESAEGNPEKLNPYVAKWTELAADWLDKKIKKQ